MSVFIANPIHRGWRIHAPSYPQRKGGNLKAVAGVFRLQGTGEPDVVRERIATRIIAAARRGERNPARLLEAALPWLTHK